MSNEQEREVRIAPESAAALEALFDSELRHRRVFISGQSTLAERERCTLVIVHPLGGRFSLLVEAVYVGPAGACAGVGFELIGLDATRLAELEAFVKQTGLEQDVEPPGVDEKEPRNLYERVRKLGLREREVVARQGPLQERVALERTYGSSVWEALLQNPQLTVPEVAHIAKNGTLPVPLVAAIVANSGWLASGEVRRALLSNPRASGGHLERVLKAMPRSELKQLAQSSPYRTQVRAAAKKLVGE